MAHRVDRKLMRDLESRTFKTFGELAKYLRERACLDRRALARAMGFKESYGVYIRQVEIGQDLQSASMLASYTKYFHLALPYLLDVDAKDFFLRLDLRLRNRVQKVRELYCLL